MRLALILTVLASTAMPVASPAPAEDVVSWIPAGGKAGWRTPIAREFRPAGTSPIPLLAPNWFAKLPKTSLPLADGGTLDLASLKGKVVLVDFWASWCGPCLAELPHLQRLHESHAPKGLAAVAVNVDEGAEVAQAFSKKTGLTMPIAIDDGLNDRFGVRILPTVVLADRSGRIRGRWDGYRNGLEKAIEEQVTRLLADDPDGILRPVAQVVKGPGTLRGVWMRDLPGEVDGVLVLPEKETAKTRIVVSGGGTLMTYDGDGEIQGKVRAPSWAGRLLDFGRDASGVREIAAYRVGATSMGIVSIPSGQTREIASGAPIATAVSANLQAAPEGRSLFVLTTAGASVARAGDTLARTVPAPAILDLARSGREGVAALYEDGSIGPIGAHLGTERARAEGAARLLAVGDDRSAAVGPRAIVASAVGRFLPGERSQLAVVTYSGHVALLDTADGTLLVDLVWPDARDVAAADLDGDGRDELVVGAGRFVTVLTGGEELTGDSLERIAQDVVRCERCPRLRSYGQEVARVKRRAFRDEEYWGRPVLGFGDPEASILFVGLAPAAHGANRTGRMFTGDESGSWLYAALHAEGLATQPTSDGRGDGLELRGAYITATCRCAPPDNKPAPAERAACAEYLDRELDVLSGVRVVVALGRIGWDAVIDRARRVDKAAARPRPAFSHGAETSLVLRAGAPPVTLLASYHPSRQNTNTGVLTREMLQAVMRTARERAGRSRGR